MEKMKGGEKLDLKSILDLYPDQMGALRRFIGMPKSMSPNWNLSASPQLLFPPGDKEKDLVIPDTTLP